MKKIEETPIYAAGPQILNQPVPVATQLLVNISGDNLKDTCWVYFELQDSEGTSLYYGNISISGSDYLSWGGDNNYPYTYIAQKINLTFVD